MNEIITTNQNEIVAVDNYREEFGNIRNVVIDNQVWLCGLDAAEAFGYASPVRALKYHVKEADRQKLTVRCRNQRREMIFINSNGFYDLCQGSTLETANQIKDWIKSKFFMSVESNINLPAITVDDFVNNKAIITKLAENVAAELAEDSIKYRELMGSKSLLSMKDVADTLMVPGIGRTKLYEILRAKKILTEDNKPYREYLEKGWFKTIPGSYKTNHGVKVKTTTKATILGLENIRRLLKEWGYC